MESSFTRGARASDIRLTPEFMNHYDATQEVIDRLLAFFREEFRSGRLLKIKKHSLVVSEDAWIPDKPVKDSEGNKVGMGCYSDTYTHAQYKNNVIPPELWENDKYSMIDNPKSLKRNLLMYVTERFLSYKQRNKNKPWNKVQPSNGRFGLYYKDAFVKLNKEKKLITLPTIYGSHELRYNYDRLFEHVDDTKIGKNGRVLYRGWGGNFNLQQRIFVFGIEVPFVPLYKPAKGNVLSFDLNKAQEDWIVFNNGKKLEMPREIGDLCQKIKIVNDILGDKKKPVSERKFRTRQRSKQRRGGPESWKTLHTRLDQAIVPLCEKIIEEAIKDQKLLSIDGVKSGQHNGSFGQDHITPILQTICERKGVPFYVTPCAYTTRTCPNCKDDSAENVDRSSDTFMCVVCGHVAKAHENAAINIANSAVAMYEKEIPYGNYQSYRGGLKQVIKEYDEKV